MTGDAAAFDSYASIIGCLDCGAEWACVYPAEADSKTLECPHCGESRSMIMHTIVRVTREEEWCRFVPPPGLTFHRRGEDGKPLE